MLSESGLRARHSAGGSADGIVRLRGSSAHSSVRGDSPIDEQLGAVGAGVGSAGARDAMHVHASSRSVSPGVANGPDSFSLRASPRQPDLQLHGGSDRPTSVVATATLVGDTTNGGTNSTRPLFPSLLSIFTYPPGFTFAAVTRDLAKQFFLAWANQILLFIGQSVVLAEVGRNFDVLTLAAAGAAITVLNVCGFSVTVGFASALDMLCSQAFGRDPHGSEVAEWTQLGIALCVAICVPFAFLFWHSAPLIAAVFGAEYALPASRYLAHVIPFLFVASVCACIVKSLQAQHRSDIPLKSTSVAAFVTVASSWVLVRKFELAGAAWSMNLGPITQLILLAVQCQCDDTVLLRRTPWFPRWRVSAVFTWERIRQYLSIGFYASIAVCSEWWCFEILMIIAARLGHRHFAAYEILISVTVLCFSFAAGVGVAASSFVGKFLGEGKPLHAFVYARTCLVWSGIFAITSATSVAVFHKAVFGAFTRDAQVIEDLKGVLGIFYIFHFCDNMQFVIGGVLRGAGRQALTATIVLCSLWLVGLPCAFVLSTVMHMELPGLLLGFAIGLGCEDVLFLWRMRPAAFDWQALADEASAKSPVRVDDDCDDEGGHNSTELRVTGATPSTCVDDSADARRDHDDLPRLLAGAGTGKDDDDHPIIAVVGPDADDEPASLRVAATTSCTHADDEQLK